MSGVEPLEVATSTLLTVREVRDVFQVSRSTVYRWIKKGLLQRVGRVRAPRGYKGQRVVLLDVVHPRLRRALNRYIIANRVGGRSEMFLVRQLAIESLTDRPSDADVGAGDGGGYVPEFEQLLARLSQETATRPHLLRELELTARRMRENPESDDQTNALGEVANALREIRERETSILEVASRDEADGTNSSAAGDSLIDIDDEDDVEAYGLTDEEDALDEEYLDALPPDEPDYGIDPELASEFPRWFKLEALKGRRVPDGPGSRLVGLDDSNTREQLSGGDHDAGGDAPAEAASAPDEPLAGGGDADDATATTATVSAESEARDATEAAGVVAAAEPPVAERLESTLDEPEAGAPEDAERELESTRTDGEDAGAGAEAGAGGETGAEADREPQPEGNAPQVAGATTDTGAPAGAVTEGDPETAADHDTAEPEAEPTPAESTEEAADGGARSSGSSWAPTPAPDVPVKRAGTTRLDPQPAAVDEMSRTLIAAGLSLIVVSWTVVIYLRTEGSAVGIAALVVVNALACWAIVHGRRRGRS